MDPVRTADCNLVYKGPNEQIGDLWCHRVKVGWIGVTYQPTEEELELLKAGGRVHLEFLTEPIPPVKLSVVTKEDSEPIAPHGFKIDKNPGDKLEEEADNGEEDQDKQEPELAREGASLQEEEGSAPQGEAADAVSA